MSQVRRLLGIEEQQYRSWRKDFEALADKKGRSAIFTVDEICLISIIDVLINDYGISKRVAIQFLNPIHNELLDAIGHIVNGEVEKIWLVLSIEEKESAEIAVRIDEVKSKPHSISINLGYIYQEVLSQLIPIKEKRQQEIFERTT